MRKLLWVPILHTEADVGSLGSLVARQTIAICGQERWDRHQRTVSRFWQAVADYFLSLDASTLRVYQDGLAVDGNAAASLLEEAARRGSPNFRLLLGLSQRGAALMKTEQPALLLAERQSLLQSVRPAEASPNAPEGAPPPERGELMAQRDQGIAQAINQTLRDGETGVLFLGAEHEVVPYLEPDIQVCFVKEPRVVRAYLRTLLSGDNEGCWRALGDLLASSISRPSSSETW